MQIHDGHTQALDCGYGSLKGCASQGEPWLIRSIYAWYDPLRMRTAIPATTRRCGYISGPAAEVETMAGRHWLVGADAGVAGRSVAMSEEADKTRVLPMLVLAGIQLSPALQNNDTYHLEHLVISVPDASPEVVAQLERWLVGDHLVSREGKELLLVIDRLSIKYEGEGAYALATTGSNAVADGSKVNLLLDCGHGTVIASVFNGKTLIHSARKVYPRSGVSALVKAIADDQEFRATISSRPDADLIRYAIENSQGGPCLYGGQGLNFDPLFQKHRRDWLIRVRDMALAGVPDAWADRISSVILCGGGANLATPRMKQAGFVVAPDPVFSNARGLLTTGGLRLAKAG